MPIHQLTLLERKEIARGTVEFRFKKPDGFQFNPGQYGGFTLIHTKDLEPSNMTRRFSLASAPLDEYLSFTTRMQNSPYKKALNELAIGESIKFAGPIGNFVLPDEDVEHAVFIAGGIGITPFYSMLKHAENTRSAQTYTLFYGNQSIQDAAYIDELHALSEHHKNINFIPVFVSNDSDKNYETGYVSYQLIKKYISDLKTPIFYICGSPAMVNALHETLKELEISDERIKMEDFPGY